MKRPKSWHDHFGGDFSTIMTAVIIAFMFINISNKEIDTSFRLSGFLLALPILFIEQAVNNRRKSKRILDLESRIEELKNQQDILSTSLREIGSK